MNGKSNRDAALQEAFEEAGIRGRGTTLPIGQYRFLKALHDGSELPCVMSVFGMTRVVELDAWPEMDQRERRWFSQAEAIEVIFDWSLARFVAEVRLDALQEAGRLSTGVLVIDQILTRAIKHNMTLRELDAAVALGPYFAVSGHRRLPKPRHIVRAVTQLGGHLRATSE